MTSLKKFAPFLVALVLLSASIGLVVGTNYSSFFRSPLSKKGATKLDTDIAAGEASVAKKPPLAGPYLGLAALYLQKARETSDASYYGKITTLTDAASKIDPKNGNIDATLASVAIGRHNFVLAKEYSTKALALNTTVPAYYGLDGDADIELGKYDDATAAFQKMVDIRPSFSSWSRIAYIRELYGDVGGAEDALKEAIASGSNYPENIAWAHVELGKLYLRTDPQKAEKAFNDALIVLPTYTQAHEGLGKAVYALGDTQGAEKEFKAAYNGLPLAQYAVDLGDLYSAEGKKTEASQQYALAQAAFAQSRKGGVNTDLEEAYFLSDHGLDLPRALDMAKIAYAARPSVYGADYLSWALYKNGKSAEAAKYSKEALRLGENDPIILYHQAVIAKAGGDTVTARRYFKKSYELSPNLSILYSVALKKELGVGK